MVEYYTACYLTHASDKIAALAGLASVVRDATDDVYLAGLCRERLEDQLCWLAHPESSNDNRSFIPKYIAPTWFWVNMDKRVKYDAAYPSFNMSSCWAEVLEASVNSDDMSNLHNFVSARLVLQGVGLCACAQQIGDGASEYRLKLSFPLPDFEFPLIEDKSDVEVAISWDESLSTFPADLRLLRAGPG